VNKAMEPQVPKLFGSSSVAERLLAFHEGLGFMEIVS
jgi:hypothetical protein